jgi:hypothetical protein
MFQPRPEASSVIALRSVDPSDVKPASNDCVEECRAFIRVMEGQRVTGHACALVLGCTAVANLEMSVRNLVAMIAAQQEKPLAQPPVPPPPQ